MKIRDNWYIVFPSVVVLAVLVFRICYTLNPGYLSPDEAIYYSTALISLVERRIVFRYYQRRIFQSFVIGLTYVLNLDNVYKYIVVMSTIFSTITLVNILLLDRISRYLDIEEEHRRWMIASLGLCVTFVLYSSFALTEIFSLFFFLSGLLLLLKTMHGGSAFYTLVSGILLAVAMKERTPYGAFYVVNALTLLIYVCRGKLKWHHIVAFGFSAFLLIFNFYSLIPSDMVTREGIMKFTKTENVTVGTTRLSYGRDPTALMDLDPVRWGSRTIVNTIVSLVLGWNPISMVIGMVGMLIWMRNIYRGERDDTYAKHSQESHAYMKKYNELGNKKNEH